MELDGKPASDVRVTFAAPLKAAREIDAQERPLGPASVEGGSLVTSFTAYQPRTFALRLDASRNRLASAQSTPVALHYDLAVATNDDTKTVGGGFDGKGNAMPAEMLPQTIEYGGVQFKLAPSGTGSANAVVPRGQSIQLPAGQYNRVYILAASADGDQKADFQLGNRIVTLNVQDWSGFIGQWDTRLWKQVPERDWAISANHPAWPPADLQERELRPITPRYPEDYIGLNPGYVKTADLAWYASHHHTADGLNQPYQYSYLFAYAIDVPSGECRLTLPNNDKIRFLAISTANEAPKLRPAYPLYDTLNRAEPPNNSTRAAR